ncbi:MAG: hypothetical protein RL596_1231 [Bacteroidota bacterium]
MINKVKLVIYFLFLSCCSLFAQKPTFTPIVFVHGFLGSGDTYASQFQRFQDVGYSNDQLFVYDWNSIGARVNNSAKLDSFIQVVLKKTGAKKVNLVGHSAGGGIGYAYLNDSIYATRVEKYVHIGSSKAAGPAGKQQQIPTLNIFSPDDKIAKAGEIPGATNSEQKGSDHYQVATSPQSFVVMYRFFNGSEPPLVEMVLSPYNRISGKACILGENTPLVGAKIDVYPIDLKKGKRLKNIPEASFVTDSAGSWGPFKSKLFRAYEFVLQPGNNQRNVYYYRQGFIEPDNLVYLRALPTTGMTSLLLKMLPAKDEQSVMVIFTSNQAVVYGRDSLAVNEMPISSAVNTPASKTAIAQFLFDDGDNTTSGNKIAAFNALPFMNGVDFFIPSNEEKPIHIYFNNRHIYLPRRKSDTEGIMVVVLN